MKLSLYFPAKPYWITQAWGIFNPVYEKFGFNRHNGQDFALGTDKHVYLPVRAEVVEQGFNESAGNFLRLVTTDKWEVGGVECYVGFMIMHYQETYLKVGQKCDAGTDTGIAGNTGFSTGPHTHISWYRLKEKKNVAKNRLDTDTTANQTFDPQQYWNGKYAVDLNKQKKIDAASKVLNDVQKIVTESKDLPAPEKERVYAKLRTLLSSVLAGLK